MMSVYSCCFQFLPLYVCIAGMINNAINNKPKITPSWLPMHCSDWALCSSLEWSGEEKRQDGLPSERDQLCLEGQLGVLVRWWKMGLLGRWPAGAKVLEDDKARDVECGRWLVLLELQDKGKWWEERSGQNGSHVPGFEGPYAYHIFIQSEPGKGSERTTTNGQNNNIHLLSYLLYASSILSTFSNSSRVLTHLQ